MASSRNNTLEFSSAGSILVSGTNSYDGPSKFGAIQFLKDSTIDEVIATNIYASDDQSTPDAGDLQDNFAAGTILYGNFTSITLDGGLVALHIV